MGTKKPTVHGTWVYIVRQGTINEMRAGDPITTPATVKAHVLKWFEQWEQWCLKYDNARYDELMSKRLIVDKWAVTEFKNFAYDIVLGQVGMMHVAISVTWEQWKGQTR
jgi:hypothetical protein